MNFGEALEGMSHGEFWETELNRDAKKTVNSALIIKDRQFIRYRYDQNSKKILECLGEVGYISTWSLQQKWVRLA